MRSSARKRLDIERATAMMDTMVPPLVTAPLPAEAPYPTASRMSRRVDQLATAARAARGRERNPRRYPAEAPLPAPPPEFEYDDDSRTHVTYRSDVGISALDRWEEKHGTAGLPQPTRSVVKVLHGILDQAWSKIEERHPEVIISLNGQDHLRGRELQHVATATAVFRPAGGVAAARWSGDAVGAPILIVGTAAGQLQLTEPSLLGNEADAAAAAALVVFEPDAAALLDAKPAPVALVSALSEREPERPCRCVVASGKPKDEEAEDDASGPKKPADDVSLPPGRVAVVEVWPSDCEAGPKMRRLATFEVPSGLVEQVDLSPDGRWLACATPDGIALHRLPDTTMTTEERGLSGISEDRAVEWQETYDRQLADLGLPLYVLPSEIPLALHWVFSPKGDVSSVVAVSDRSNVVVKWGLGAAPAEPPETPSAPPRLATWALPSNVTASALAVRPAERESKLRGSFREDDAGSVRRCKNHQEDAAGIVCDHLVSPSAVAARRSTGGAARARRRSSRWASRRAPSSCGTCTWTFAATC